MVIVIVIVIIKNLIYLVGDLVGDLVGNLVGDLVGEAPLHIFITKSNIIIHISILLFIFFLF